MAIVTRVGQSEAHTELDAVWIWFGLTTTRPTGSRCVGRLTERPDGSQATLTVARSGSDCVGLFEPDRWGRYVVTGGGQTAEIAFWPVAYETVVAWDVAIPIAGIFPAVAGDEVFLYGEPLTRRAEAWWDAISAPALDARANSKDGFTFDNFVEAPIRSLAIGNAPASDVVLNYPGYGRIRDIGGAWVMHTVQGTELWRWTSELGPFEIFILSTGTTVPFHWMTLAYPRRVDWTADSLDLGMKNTQDAIVEPIENQYGAGSRMLFAYQADANNRVHLLHAPIRLAFSGGNQLDAFRRPTGCAAPCEPFVGDGGPSYGVDTPWFFPEFVEPFDVESIRLTALYHPKTQAGEMRENTGWASWRREVGAEQEIWDYEGMFFTLDHSQEGMRDDQSIHFTEDDFTCAQGDHTIVTLDGVDLMYVPVGNFRGWWPSTDAERQAAYEERLARFMYADVKATDSKDYLVSYVDERAGRTKQEYKELDVRALLERFGITTTETEVTGFDCSYCIAYEDTTVTPKEKRIAVDLVPAGGTVMIGGEEVRTYTLQSTLGPEDPLPAGWETRQCDLVLQNAFLEPVEKTWAPSPLEEGSDELREASAHFTMLCFRYCTDTALVLATSRAVGA